MTPTKKPLAVAPRIILRSLTVLNNCFTLPLMKWVARQQFEPLAAPAPGGYVEGTGPVTPLAIMAAHRETMKAAEADPTGFQSELNACMEAIGSDPLKAGMIQMFGALIGAGRAPDDALVRVCANFLQLGMYVERAGQDRTCKKCGAVLLTAAECPHCGTAIQEQPA